MKRQIIKLWRIVGSRRFAVVLLLALVIVLALSSAVPPLETMNPVEVNALKNDTPLTYRLIHALQIGTITSHPLFLLWPLFLFISVLQCTTGRIGPHLKTSREKPTAESIPAGTVFLDCADASAILANGRKVLTDDGWNLAEQKTGTGDFISGEKGLDGFWGSVTFHLGMIVVIVGVGVSLLTGFHGAFLISEGQTVRVADKSGYLYVLRDSKYSPDLPEASLRLDKFAAGYNESGVGVSFELDMTVDENGLEIRPAKVEVNRPLAIQGMSVAFRQYGFNPRFVVTDERGKTVYDAYVRINSLGPQTLDSFFISELDNLEVVLRFFPNHLDNGKSVKNLSIEPKSPAFLVQLSSNDDKPKLLKLGESVEIDGLKIEFTDLNYWAYMEADKDPAVWLMSAGFLFLVGGLLFRLVYYERKITIYIDGNNGFALWGNSKYFPALFEEELEKYKIKIART